MKKFFIISLFMALFSISMDAQQMEVEGTWEFTSAAIMSEGEELMTMDSSMLGMDFILTFFPDSTGIVTVAAGGEEESQEFEYEVNEDYVLIVADDELYVGISGSRLYMEMEEEGVLIRIYFEKQ